ncbi:MAG: hypothetical protein QOF78_1304 [Phycisphaerales bacterium]|jgi:hypothetical protein|nr:hypothetical protein [Phycisphaerales bacterium]
MIETPPQELPPPALLQRDQQLQVDTFCTNCGYNLHGQPVTRDARLGLIICRCPECGQHHPAGVGVTAASVWTTRLATALLVFWVLIVLNAIFWICIGLGAITFEHWQMFTFSKEVGADGREITYVELPPPSGIGGATWTPVYKGTTQPVGEVRRVRMLEPPDDPRWRHRFLAFNLISATVLSLGAGVLLVVFMWHWRRRRYALATVMPFVIAACAVTFMSLTDYDDEYAPVQGWMISRALRYAALEAAFFALGIWIGRPVARGLLRMFIPPRARQYFAFLWRIDGKIPPPATVVSS